MKQTDLRYGMLVKLAYSTIPYKVQQIGKGRGAQHQVAVADGDTKGHVCTVTSRRIESKWSGEDQAKWEAQQELRRERARTQFQQEFQAELQRQHFAQRVAYFQIVAGLEEADLPVGERPQSNGKFIGLVSLTDKMMEHLIARLEQHYEGLL